MVDGIVPELLVLFVALHGNHLESLLALLARTNVGAVAASQAVHHVNNLYEGHALEALADGFELVALLEGRSGSLGLVHNEGTDGSVRADERALVTLDTVFGLPDGNEGTHTALLIGSGTGIPSTILATLECAHGQQVTVLGVDGTYHVVYKCGSVVGSGTLNGQVAPSGINGQLGVLVTTVNGLVVLVHHVLTLAAIGLHDELLHLLDGQVNGDNLGDAEEGTLQDGVGAVAQTNLLSDLGGVDVVNLDVVVGEVLLHVVGQVLGQLVAVPNGVQQEGTTLLQTAGHVIHVQISLNVASHEVGRGHQIGRADGLVAKAQV